MKKTVKSTNPLYIVDLTDIYTAEDTILAFVVAKIKHICNAASVELGFPIFVEVHKLDDPLEAATKIAEKTPAKKHGFFKRVWNFLAGK